MEEYVIKLTQTEAEALTYAIGSLPFSTTVLNEDMFKTLKITAFIENDILYNRYRIINHSGFRIFQT
jgi:hypothetical protein